MTRVLAELTHTKKLLKHRAFFMLKISDLWVHFPVLQWNLHYATLNTRNTLEGGTVYTNNRTDKVVSWSVWLLGLTAFPLLENYFFRAEVQLWSFFEPGNIDEVVAYIQDRNSFAKHPCKQLRKSKTCGLAHWHALFLKIIPSFVHYKDENEV